MANAKMAQRVGTIHDVMLGRGADPFPNTVLPPQATNCMERVGYINTMLDSIEKSISELTGVLYNVTGSAEISDGVEAAGAPDTFGPALHYCASRADYLAASLRDRVEKLRRELGV